MFQRWSQHFTCPVVGEIHDCLWKTMSLYFHSMADIFNPIKEYQIFLSVFFFNTTYSIWNISFFSSFNCSLKCGALIKVLYNAKVQV